ncbi:glycosyltransferase [Engelhardtia mirabilis]|uniref:glycosyltransferase n=1 Tax=Engelhardtia mirabilis TaxID=2528011 RepID=UPI003AF36AB3
MLTRLNLGGPARQVLACDPILAARGHRVRVLVGRPEPGEGDLFEAALERGIDVRRIDHLARGPHPWRDLRARRALGRELAEFRPELVHTHASKAGALGRAAAWKRTTAPLVHTFHGHVLEGYFPRLIARRLIAHERRWAGRSAAVIAVSGATARDLDRLGVCPLERIRVVPPGVELERLLSLPDLWESRDPMGVELRTRLGIGSGDVLVGMLGRLAPIKRPELALAAFVRLAASGVARLHLAFVGDGEGRAPLEAARAALPGSLRERVHLLGAVADVLPVHAALDLLLLTSKNEGLPVALIEGAAAGRPAVALAVGGVPELIEDGVTGRLVGSDGDPETMVSALARAMASLVDDGPGRVAMGCAAREVARTRHTGAALADRLEAVYAEALALGRTEVAR